MERSHLYNHYESDFEDDHLLATRTRDDSGVTTTVKPTISVLPGPVFGIVCSTSSVVLVALGGNSMLTALP